MSPTSDPFHPGNLPEADDDSDAAAPESAFAEMRERWMRSEAEIANVRNRARRDVDDARQFAVQKFATDVVEAAENLHRGLEGLPAASAHEPENMTGIRRGLLEIERGFIGVLERNGVKREDPTGSAFDPNRHQAMSEQEAAGTKAGTILHTLAPTWTLNGRLLRPAMVIVAKAASAPPSATPPHPAR
uniref:nucleotide exchange factor GrpE n=1 Tax=uncultured Sphingomonas sp. TaxID=158754 RepID=UPI0035CA0274